MIHVTDRHSGRVAQEEQHVGQFSHVVHRDIPFRTYVVEPSNLDRLQAFKGSIFELEDELTVGGGALREYDQRRMHVGLRTTHHLTFLLDLAYNFLPGIDVLPVNEYTVSKLGDSPYYGPVVYSLLSQERNRPSGGHEVENVPPTRVVTDNNGVYFFVLAILSDLVIRANGPQVPPCVHSHIPPEHSS